MKTRARHAVVFGAVVAVCLALSVTGLSMVRGQPALPSDAPACRAAELNTEFGHWFNYGLTLRPDPVVPPGGIKPAGGPVRGMRLQARIRNRGTGAFKVTFRDGQGHLLTILDAGDFDPAENTVWTGNMYAPQIYPEVVSRDRSVRVEIVQGVAIPQGLDTSVLVYSLQDKARPRWATMFTGEGDASRNKLASVVGMMHTGAVPVSAPVGASEKASWCCSGVMIANDLFLTNYHCGMSPGATTAGWEKAKCDATTVDLGWEEGGVRRQFACRKVEAADYRLDFAILRLRPVSGQTGGRGGSLAVALADSEPRPGDELFVIHHAECAYKRISTPCKLVGRRAAWTDPDGVGAQTEFTHDCDTETGASGAPVFDAAGKLVGLHHLGFANCGGTPDKLNKAIGVDHIKHFVMQSSPALAQELGWN